MKQLDKSSNRSYELKLNEHESEYIRNESDLIEYLSLNKIDKLIIKKDNYNKNEELVDVLKICAKSNFETIIEFIECSDGYLEVVIVEELKKYGINSAIFSFDYNGKRSNDYLMADKGHMCDLIKSILNSSMIFKDISLKLVPLNSNYYQIGDIMFISDAIGITKIDISFPEEKELELSKVNKAKFLNELVKNADKFSGEILINNIEYSKMIVKQK